ncbi:MAG: hypothetical protein ACR2P3_00570 [Geminicoccaceae bacterium]
MNANPADNRPSLADLVRDLTGVGGDDSASLTPPAQAPSSGAELTLSDLISDDNGEIVFFNDGGFRTLSIATETGVVSSGQAVDHKTATGEDVSGFNYVTFANGLTLYFEDGLDLLLP